MRITIMIKSNNRRRNTKPKGLNEVESNFVKSVTDGTVTPQTVKEFISTLLEAGTYDDMLEKYFTDKYADEHADQIGTILENEDLIQKQESTLSKLNRSINEKELQLERQSTTEAYIERNSLKAQKEKLSNTVNESAVNANTDNTPKVMTGDEDLSVKAYMKSKRNYKFLKERMAKGSTFDQALVECGADRYEIDLIIRGIKNLNEGIELINIRSNHLF